MVHFFNFGAPKIPSVDEKEPGVGFTMVLVFSIFIGHTASQLSMKTILLRQKIITTPNPTSNN